MQYFVRQLTMFYFNEEQEIFTCQTGVRANITGPYPLRRGHWEGFKDGSEDGEELI